MDTWSADETHETLPWAMGYAETLPEAMERGDVKSEKSGNASVYKVYKPNDGEPEVINGNHVNLWRQLAAVLSLWLQCYTAEEIAEAVGMNQKTVEKLFLRIRKYEIVGIPGMFAEGLPDDSAAVRRGK